MTQRMITGEEVQRNMAAFIAAACGVDVEDLEAEARHDLERKRVRAVMARRQRAIRRFVFQGGRRRGCRG